MRNKMAAVGTYPDGGPPEILAARMKAELRNWAEAIRVSGAVVE